MNRLGAVCSELEPGCCAVCLRGHDITMAESFAVALSLWYFGTISCVSVRRCDCVLHSPVSDACDIPQMPHVAKS